MVALNLAATYSLDLGGILVYGGTAGGVKSFAPPLDVWKGIVNIGRGDTEGVAKYMFPEGLKDMGMCPLYASWNSFYRSKYTSADRLTVRGEQVRRAVVAQVDLQKQAEISTHGDEAGVAGREEKIINTGLCCEVVLHDHVCC